MANSEAVTVVKRVKNAVLRSDGTIRIDHVRASYPHLAEAYAGDDGGKPSFGIVGLLNKETHEEAFELINDAIDKLIANSKDRKTNKPPKIAADKRFLKDGDDSDKTENEGSWTVSARETKRPSVRDRRGDKMEDKAEIEETIYGGCYVNILVRPWYQDNDYGKRINAGLVGVQFVKDGEPFGEGRINDDDAWDEVEADDDGDL